MLTGNDVGQRACRRTFPGRPDQVSEVRRFVAELLAGCPLAEEAELLASELATNAVQHTRSGHPGGLFTLAVEVRAWESVRIAVTDEGGPTPVQPGSDSDCEHGRGLFIVEALAAEWGVTGDSSARTVWFALTWPSQR